jgi:hypothetical protein
MAIPALRSRQVVGADVVEPEQHQRQRGGGGQQRGRQHLERDDGGVELEYGDGALGADRLVEHARVVWQHAQLAEQPLAKQHHGRGEGGAGRQVDGAVYAILAGAGGHQQQVQRGGDRVRECGEVLHGAVGAAAGGVVYRVHVVAVEGDKPAKGLQLGAGDGDGAGLGLLGADVRLQQALDAAQHVNSHVADQQQHLHARDEAGQQSGALQRRQRGPHVWY